MKEGIVAAVFPFSDPATVWKPVLKYYMIQQRLQDRRQCIIKYIFMFKESWYR